MTWIPDGSSWKWIHLIFDQDLLQWVANSVTSGQSYKHFTLINYDSRVALSENYLYYNLRVVIYECKIFYRIHFQIGRNFGNKIKAFINSWRVYFVLGKILNLLWQKNCAFGHMFTIVNCQLLEKISSYLVTLVANDRKHIRHQNVFAVRSCRISLQCRGPVVAQWIRLRLPS